MTAPDVTLLICTRDRCAPLAATLASVARAIGHAPHVRAEVVVVDNGSTDATPRLLAGWRAAHDFPVILVHEPRPGLACARNAGLARRRGRIVAMTDDDCVLHADYLTALARAFAAADRPAIIGGRILLGDPADLPVTVKLEDHPMIADPRDFPGGFVMGANLAFDAAILDRIGPFDVRFGAGAPFVAAEDTDFLFRATGAGVVLAYDPHMVVDHHHGRRDPDTERQLLTGYSFGDGALYAKHMFRDSRIARAIWRDIADLTLDYSQPVTIHAGVRRFYRFRLYHKLRGVIGYWRGQRRRFPAA